MRSNNLKATLKTTVLAASLLLLSVGVSFAQQVNLTAGPATTTLPDGSVVPMWGYSCDTTQPTGSTAACAALNPAALLGQWSPVVITVPPGSLTINLTNNLSFNGNAVPTSLVIVGQLGGGLGTGATYTPSPGHDAQGVTWPTANTGAQNVPPPQGPRVQSFATEVVVGTPQSLTWSSLRPGTYLIESGTHPSIQGSMGLYGILVVTSAPTASAAGTAYPGVSYSAEVPLLLSEIDPYQNNAVRTAVNTVGFQESATHGPMVGSAVASFNVTAGGTAYSPNNPPTVVITGGGGVGATATATVNASGVVTGITLGSGGSGYAFPPNVTITDPSGAGATATAVLVLQSAQTRLCGGAPACYPPVVNYAPLYYLINGAAFDKTNPSNSLFQASIGTATPPVTGSVLVRLVNAGLRMHVPSIVGTQTTPLSVPTGNTAAAVPGFSLIAEDGNRVPGTTRVQTEVFMAAGKTYDVMIDVPANGTSAVPVFDRELSLSGSATERDAGMLAYIGVNGSAISSAITTAASTAAVANPDTYNYLTACAVDPCPAVSVSDPTKGVLANDVYVYRANVVAQPAHGTVTLNANGTFTYVPVAGTTSDSFTYCGNGASSGAACATVTLGSTPIEAAGGITCGNLTYTSNVATSLSIGSPGVLSACKDGAGYPLTVVPSSVVQSSSLSVTVDKSGSFVATVPSAGTYTFAYSVQSSIGTPSATTACDPVNTVAGCAIVTLNFPSGSNLQVSVVDGNDKTTQITDYRWVIEEDLTFFVDPKCTTNPLPAGCPTVTPQGAPAAFGTNFHTSHTPVVATGCTGSLSCEGGQTVLGSPAVCDVGNGVCRPDTTGSGFTAVDPKQVYLDPTKRYYISVLPGDAAQPFIAGTSYSGPANCSATPTSTCGHGMGGAPIAAAQTSVTVLTQPSPFPPAKLSIFVFEDDFPLNGEHNSGGGIDVLSPQEPGLGGFQITLQDFAGGTGDATGTPTYDMFNQPLTNSLAGTIDPATGQDACPLSVSSRTGVDATNGNKPGATSSAGISGMIVTCPKYESDGTTLSPLAGQAVVNNLYPGRYGVVAMPGADRIARGEEWLQTNTLDGQKAHDAFMRVGEPGYFQEFGPAGYHVTIGFANPAIINGRLKSICNGTNTDLTAKNCNNTVTGHVTTARMSRPPDERLYGSGDRSSFAFTQCYAALGDPDGPEFAFVKCDKDGNFTFTGIPTGNWKLTLFDQWNDQIVDGIMTPVAVAGQNSTVPMGEIAAHQWQANFFSRTFIDLNGDGVSDPINEPGLALVKTNVRYRDGSISNRNNTDLNGYAAFNEEFPLFNWYVIETDVTRYKNTGTHVVYDAGGSTDTTGIAAHFANTNELIPLPTNLHVPGAVYCATGDCSAESIATSPVGSNSPATNSTGRIDPPWVLTEGWQGYSGQNNFLEFGKKPYAEGENGGIRGHVVYSSTRPFDDPQFGTQNVWEPLVPNVTVNLYKEFTAPDGTTSLTLVDTTQTSSFDKWAQGFRSDGIPNMNCPGQSTNDPYFFGLQNQPNYLDWYNSQHGGPSFTPLPANSQFKCYDGMHTWNQLQPAPYDGMYQFPSVTAMDPVTGKPTGTNCTKCVTNPDTTDPYRNGLPMLPKGKYVVEVVVPPGYALVKEEDKNILIGDNFIAPVTQEFGGLGNVFILPDQASIASSYNSNSAQNQTNSLGRNQALVSHEGDTPTVDTFWPCVGATRTVPDYISLFPQSKQVAPFAGATRNLCDRKEVTLDDQTSSQAEFFVFTPTHVASKFTGVITDDFSAEFDPFSPQFGEKFGPSYLPVSIKDWAGNEISRVYADEFGAYNGMSYSTWEVNPPNPTGYAPTMMVTCMNDRGAGATPDPLYQPGYSQFCYELPFMPGATGYFDTPVVPTSAFADGYNHPDCAYPDATPAILSVTGSDGVAGPWVQAPGSTLTITALPDQLVDTYGYSGPQVTDSRFNKQKVSRHYGFGGTAGTVALVGSDGVSRPLTGVSWGDGTITGTVPSGVAACAVQQQQPLYAPAGTTTAQCGQLVITTASGQQSIDTVTVTIGGKTPTVLAAGASIQSAIDGAQPGDLIIVPPGYYSEMVLMWKPVRLQGVGAASSIINASPHPAGKLDAWRRQLVCLFGLTPDGRPNSSDTSCSSRWKAASGGPAYKTMIVDRIPLEGILGWDTTVNGNLAEQLIEPSLMGAYEGAAITVLAKGVNITAGQGATAYGVGAESAFPTGTVLLTANDCTDTNGNNPYPSNFYCNPSSIDGLGITNSSQGGGGIYAHAYAHYIQIANNRVHNNTGTLSGGITIGQGEHVDLPLAGVPVVLPPNSCEGDPLNLGTLLSGQTLNQGLPYCYNVHVNIHNNAVATNSSMGDELFSSTPAGAGGVSIANGADYYQFKNNWVCGNMSTGDGGGFAHIGWSKNGDIEHNSILFNQSTNPTITANGGGLLVMGAPDPDPPCSLANDKDCVPDPSSVPPSDGSGPGLVINANLILGNSADSGSGGGLRLQHVNGTDVVNFPNGAVSCPTPGSAACLWNSVTVTNNIITNNVAGWDGGGVSLQDALAVNIINNTIVSNDSTATAGPLFGSLFAPLASTPGTNCTTNNGSQSCPQVAGLVSIPNSPILVANLGLGTPVICPPGYGDTNSNSCGSYSVPLLANNIIYQNRSFFIGVGGLGSGQQNMQKVVTLFNSFTTTPAVSQTATGACPAASYWDIGVRGDTGPAPANHAVVNGLTYLLNPMYSVLSDAGDYPGAHNLGANPALQSQYCNGSKVPPELGSMGYTVNPGTNELNALPTPVFSLTPAATVDEGNNWINLRWGPLALTHPVTGAMLGNYAPAANSIVNDAIPSNSPTYALAPSTDFFGHPRPDAPGSQIDIGAIEIAGAAIPAASVAPASVAFGNQLLNTASTPQTVTLSNSGDGTLLITGITVTGTNASEFVISSCPTSLAPGGSCVINITFTPTASGARSASLTVASNDPTNPTLTVPLTGTGVAPIAVVAPTSLAFGNQLVNSASAAQTVTLSNAGNYPLSIASISLSDTTNYSSTSTCGGSVAPAASCTISIAFTPKAMGALPATLTVTDNSNAVPGSTQTVSISGFGIEPIAGVSATTLTFGNQLITTTSTSQTVTLFNSGNAPLTIASIGLTGANANQFATSGSTCPILGAGLAAGSSCNINVAFSPATTGAKTASLTFTDNDKGITGSQQNVALSGTGVNTIVTPASLTFAATPVNGTSASQTLTISNRSGGTKAVGITFSGPFARPTGTAGGSCTANLTNNNSCTINVVFKPTVGGPATGSVAITLGGSAVGNSPVSLSGTGIPLPTLTSISPNSGVRGDSSFTVTLIGTNLTGASAVTVSGNGVTAAGVTVVDSAHVTATFTIAATANANQRTVTVTTPGGNSNTVTFTVVAPTVTGVTPNTGLRGTSVPVTITGTGLATATAASVSGTGVTVSGFTAVNDTTATATFAISNTATLGALNVTVVTPSGNITLNNSFTVTGPTLASIAPTTGARGTTVPVTLTGTNLTGATAVTASGTNVTCTITGTPTATTVNANCVIAASANLTARNVSVTTPIGTTGTVTFTVVNPPAATLASVTPNSSTVAQRGTTVGVTLAGSNFTTGSTVAVSGTGITVSGVTVVSSTQITANFAISSGTTGNGSHNVTVTNASGTASNSRTFTKN